MRTSLKETGAMGADKKKKRIGVFVCSCGGNISSVLDVAEIAEYSRSIEDVEIAEWTDFYCSGEGQDLIWRRIAGYELNRIVIAGCEPSFHEAAFKRTLERARIDPHYLVMIDIRAKILSGNGKAMEEVKHIIKEGVSKAKRIVIKRRTLNKNVLVIGAGITGMQASLDLADAGFHVYLVEREPSIGGNMAKVVKTFPTDDCAMCTISPKMNDVLAHERIELFTYSEVKRVEGELGGFDVEVLKKPRFIDEGKCTGCGKCFENCLVRNLPYIEKRAQMPELSPDDLEKTNRIITNYNAKKEAVLAILQDIQAEYRYIPQDVLRYVAQRLSIPVSQAYNIATFFTAFSLTPKGENIINVCLGTACHVRGAQNLMDALESELGIKDGETTQDQKFTLESVRCLGCCALAPVLTVNGKAHGKLTVDMVPSVLKQYA
jgi:NADH:ubiquinone oxidoreductase subunit E